MDHGRRDAGDVRAGRAGGGPGLAGGGPRRRPRKLSVTYFALGGGAREQADSYLKDYYGWLGEFAGQIAAGAAVSAEMVRGYASAFEQAGCDELIFCPTSSDPAQVSLLAEAVR